MQRDPWLFGWDESEAAQGIVSVWADGGGSALIWRRLAGQLSVERACFRPWLYAQSLAELEAAAVVPSHDDPTAAFSYQKLPGAASSMAYLISARDGRLLRNKILVGYNKIHQTQHSSLEQVNSCYQLGFVEQYLIASGRNYFGGLQFHDLLRLQFDLETTGLDSADARIFMVAVRDSSGFEVVLEAPQASDEAQLIRDLIQLILERDPDCIENHNLMGFDLPFLQTRAQGHGIALALGRKPGPLLLSQVREGRDPRFSLAGREMLDTLDATWRMDFVVRTLPSHGLKDVAKFFGVAAPERVYIAGKDVFKTYQTQPERVRAYALDDVREVDAISQRLHPSVFALSQMAPRRYERIAYAGSAMGILEPLLLRAYWQAGRAWPRSQQPNHDSPHAGGALTLFASGVAKQIVKADIASLYPSIIRSQNIGPQCDELGVFVHLVDQLTELRLDHKAQAKTLPLGSPAQGQHEAAQAAMKLIINAAYGYLGAGQMAWFADRAAADEITRQGRVLLGQVCTALRAEGAVLIEADTDGVYFALPEGSSETDERMLVQKVAATLPDGLKLEFDGRFRAMFSHEVKNYALLGYDGSLLLRGGALHSSRSEAFGQDFLRQALLLLLSDQIAAIRELYLQVLERLSLRQYSLLQVATSAKLTKTPAQYHASGRSEATYEAMLASGHHDWRRGQRVKLYCSSIGWRILPADDTAATPTRLPDYDIWHYRRSLRKNYAERLRSGFSNRDFELLFQDSAQAGLFDGNVHEITAQLQHFVNATVVV
jgi:DNA polymerase, archaea type